MQVSRSKLSTDDAELGTVNSTVARSPPSREKSGITADIDSQDKILDGSEWMGSSQGKKWESPDPVDECEGIRDGSASDHSEAADCDGGAVIYALWEGSLFGARGTSTGKDRYDTWTTVLGERSNGIYLLFLHVLRITCGR